MVKLPLDMKDVQQYALNILIQISNVCEQNNFRYSLAYGTLIGSIRHKGFIPWDDDIDIFMPRPDYDAFLNYMQNNPIPYLKVFNVKTEKKCSFAITRISDMRFIIEETKNVNCGMGIFIDVYPVDGLGNNIEESIMVYDETRALKDEIVRIATKSRLPYRFLFTSTKEMLYSLYLKIRGTNYILKHIENVIFRRNYNDCIYVGVPIWTWNNAIYQRTWFDEYITVEFEGRNFKSIKCYDEFLRLTYGDYMKLPPVEDRIYHHAYKAYIR